MATEVALLHLPCLVHVSQTLQEQLWVEKTTIDGFAVCPLQRIQEPLTGFPQGRSLHPTEQIQVPWGYNQPRAAPPQGERHRLVCGCCLPPQHRPHPLQQPLQGPQGSRGRAPCTLSPLPQKGSSRPHCSSRAEEDVGSLGRSPSCSCSAQQRQQEALSGWQHWLLSRLFPLPVQFPRCSFPQTEPNPAADPSLDKCTSH